MRKDRPAPQNLAPGRRTPDGRCSRQAGPCCWEVPQKRFYRTGSPHRLPHSCPSPAQFCRAEKAEIRAANTFCSTAAALFCRSLPHRLPHCFAAQTPHTVSLIHQRRQGAGSREQGAGSREQGAGSREQGAGSRGGPLELPARCPPSPEGAAEAEGIEVPRGHGARDAAVAHQQPRLELTPEAPQHLALLPVRREDERRCVEEQAHPGDVRVRQDEVLWRELVKVAEEAQLGLEPAGKCTIGAEVEQALHLRLVDRHHGHFLVEGPDRGDPADERDAEADGHQPADPARPPQAVTPGEVRGQRGAVVVGGGSRKQHSNDQVGAAASSPPPLCSD
eukprot:gene2967-biopygen2099